MVVVGPAPLRSTVECTDEHTSPRVVFGLFRLVLVCTLQDPRDTLMARTLKDLRVTRVRQVLRVVLCVRCCAIARHNAIVCVCVCVCV